jgi:hypothetical protein
MKIEFSLPVEWMIFHQRKLSSLSSKKALRCLSLSWMEILRRSLQRLLGQPCIGEQIWIISMTCCSVVIITRTVLTLTKEDSRISHKWDIRTIQVIKCSWIQWPSKICTLSLNSTLSKESRQISRHWETQAFKSLPMMGGFRGHYWEMTQTLSVRIWCLVVRMLSPSLKWSPLSIKRFNARSLTLNNSRSGISCTLSKVQYKTIRLSSWRAS